jgi:hypothetical protein
LHGQGFEPGAGVMQMHAWIERIEEMLGATAKYAGAEFR